MENGEIEMNKKISGIIWKVIVLLILLLIILFLKYYKKKPLEPNRYNEPSENQSTIITLEDRIYMGSQYSAEEDIFIEYLLQEVVIY